MRRGFLHLLGLALAGSGYLFWGVLLLTLVLVYEMAYASGQPILLHGTITLSVWILAIANGIRRRRAGTPRD